ncbi:lactoylglutathione lyase [Undibacterium arcticum]|uniref:Aldoketomutase n=1 Tax=Undibacterium arcticum TaxID=1762892 RepID=A0ABV7EUN4_9BURK
MKYRLMHTMMRVVDLNRSLDFYVRLLGMQVLRRTDYPTQRFTNTFVGYGDEESETVLELTWNWDRSESYDKGDAWGHLAIGVDDIEAAVDAWRNQGVTILREPGRMRGGTRVIAFIGDPDGYKIELLQNKMQE